MTDSGKIFLVMLMANTLLSTGYLLWYLLLKKDTDNRKQYVIHAVIMLICPVIGIAYFALGFLKYHFIRIGHRDLTDVEFAKKKRVSALKADEKRERNIVSVEESILISDQEKKRTNMLNVLLGDTEESFSAIAFALKSDDSEVAHYAASFLQSKLDTFRENVRQTQRQIEKKEITQKECQEKTLALIRYMNHMLRQKVFTQEEQILYVGQMEQLCEKMYENAREKMEPACYEAVLERMLELKEYERAEQWGIRFCEQYPEELSSYTFRLKLYFETSQREKFFKVLDELRRSSVVVDNKTLQLIRMIQR